MKKIKEFLIFIILIILLSLCALVSIVYEVFPVGLDDSSVLFSNAHYIKLLLSDELFYKSIFNTYYKAIIPSAVIVILFALTVHFLNMKLSRLLFYVIDSLSSAAVAFGYLLFDSSRIGYPLSYYPAHTIMYSASTLQTMNNYHILPDLFFALLSGVLTVFTYWIVESIYYTLKNRK